MKVFFATDIHGSEICWRKFLNAAAFYKADMVILGGDVTGKVMVPIVSLRPGHWEVTFGGQRVQLDTQAELDDIKRKIRDRGYYPAVMSGDELDALSEEDGSVDRRFTQEMTKGLEMWLDMADSKLRGGEIPCILNGGNDDIWEIDDIIEQSPSVSFAESKVLDIGGFYLASMGWTNPTPWNTFREAPEDVLAAKIDAVVVVDPGHGPGDVQLPRAAVRHRARRGARPGREHAADARRRGDEAGGVDRGEGGHPEVPADAVGARAHPREQGGPASSAGPWP